MIAEHYAQIAERIGRIFGERPPAGERGTNIVSDTAQRIANAIREADKPAKLDALERELAEERYIRKRLERDWDALEAKISEAVGSDRG